MEPGPAHGVSHRALRGEGGARRRRARVSFTSVLGELLMTGGLVVLLFVVWQLWVGDMIYGAQANAEGAELSDSWAIQFDGQELPPAPDPVDGGTDDVPVVTAEPVLIDQPRDTVDFAVLHVPRFGEGFSVPIAGGVTRAGTIDRQRVGYYLDTQLPGEVGNFGLAGHRTTYGAPFGAIAELRIGDPIIIETPEGWFTYRFRSLEYVSPYASEVLAPVPRAPGMDANDRVLTMTSCSPKFSSAERIIAYSLFDSFTPRAAGPPAVLASAEDV